MIMKAKNNKRSQYPVRISNSRSSENPKRTMMSKQIAKSRQTIKLVETANHRQTTNPKRTMNSKQIAKLVRTVKSRQTVKFGLTEQIARITEMEALFTKCEETVRQLHQAMENSELSMPDLTNFASVLKVLNADFKDLTSASSSLNFTTQIPDLKDLTSVLSILRSALFTLEAYYTSPAWRTDFEADEAGLLPPDLKRGVLSEDGIYNLLEEYKRVEEEVKGMFSKKISKNK